MPRVDLQKYNKKVENPVAITPMAMDRQATPTMMAPTVSTKRLRLAISSGENHP